MSSGGGQVALLLRVARTPGLRRVQLSFAAFAFSEHATWLAVLVYALQRGGPREVGVFAGPLAAGVIMGLWSPTAVFVVTAVIVGCASATVLVVDQVDDAAEAPTAVDAGHVVEAVLAGFAALRTHHRLRALVILGASAGLLKGVSDVVVVTFADARLDGGSGQAGWLAAACGVGAIIGAAGTTRLARTAQVNRQYVSAALFGGVSLLALAAIGHLGPALLAFAVMGTGETILQLTSSVSIQRHAPADLLARVFGILEGLSMAAIAIGSLAVTVLVTSTSLGTALIIVATALSGSC